METEKLAKQNFEADRSGQNENNFIECSLTLIGRDRYFENQLIGIDPDLNSAISDLDKFFLSSEIKGQHNKEDTLADNTASPEPEPVIIKEEIQSDTQPVEFIVRFQDSHGKSIKIWECITCGRRFNHQYILFRHLPVHSDVRNFSCPECGKAFRQLSTLTQHLAIHSVDRPHVCDICKKSFNRVSTLISHKKTHLPLKPFQCHLCSKSFHQKGNLRNHIFIHTNERPYRCQYCNKGFNQMSNLVCHKQKSHSEECSSLWPCHRCDKTFIKRNQLRAHEFESHQIKRVIRNSTKKTTVIPDEASKSEVPTLQRGIFLPAIDTSAMKVVQSNGETPFAVLHFLKGVPLLVRVISYANQSLLRPATKADFDALKRNSETVSLPLVAAIHQTLTADGHFDFKVFPPRNIYKFASNQKLKLQYENQDLEMSKNEQIEVATSAKSFPKNVKKCRSYSSPARSLIPNKKVKVEPIPSVSNIPSSTGMLLFGDDSLSEEEMNKIFENITAGEPLVPKEIQEEAISNEDSGLSFSVKDDVKKEFFKQLLEVIQLEGLDPDYDKIQNMFTENGII